MNWSEEGLPASLFPPGSRSAALARAAQDHPRAEVAVLIDERSASFFALGVARISGHPAAVITTSGTAVANLYAGVMESDASGVPLILLTADRPPELRETGANQTIDQLKLFGETVRWFWEAGPAEDRPRVQPVLESFGRPGGGGGPGMERPTRTCSSQPEL